MKYSKEKTIERVKEALQPKMLYNRKFVNWTGITSDTGERYSEIISELLLQDLSGFDKTIPQITRKKDYKVDRHTGETTTGNSLATSNRNEEYIALGMFKKNFEYIGEIIDYQTPLKNKRSDRIGKIDLLSYDNCLHMLELKGQGSKETLLRCILEIYTYWKTVNREKLVSDFGKPKNTKVCKGILIWKDCQAHKDFEQLPKTKELARKLEVDVYVLEKNDNRIEVKCKLKIDP